MIPRTTRRLVSGACLAMVLATAPLSGCGQKGPLYFPTQEQLQEFEELEEKKRQREEREKRKKTGDGGALPGSANVRAHV